MSFHRAEVWTPSEERLEKTHPEGSSSHARKQTGRHLALDWSLQNGETTRFHCVSCRWGRLCHCGPGKPTHVATDTTTEWVCVRVLSRCWQCTGDVLCAAKCPRGVTCASPGILAAMLGQNVYAAPGSPVKKPRQRLSSSHTALGLHRTQ